MPSFAGAGPSSALAPGDCVAVIGASGNVGKLVALRLSDTYKVHGVLRDASSVDTFLDKDSVNFYQVDLLEDLTTGGSSKSALEAALQKAHAICICTGTTAFPTKAWSKEQLTDITGLVVSALLKTKFNIPDALSFLDEQGLNTPNNIDNKANAYILETWKRVCTVPKKRIIMQSSIGVQRRDQMPFPVLNACGVLDAKAAGEESVIRFAKDNGLSYTIIRPGQLFGGPYDNNYYLGTLFQLDKDSATADIEVGRGDILLGDTLRSTLAEVTAQVCETDTARDLDFAVINTKGSAPTIDALKAKLTVL